MTRTATLALDCRCTLGEGIVWSPRRRSLLWTDIEKSALWMYRPHDRVTRQWSLPDRLGSFVLCESGRLLLGLAKSLAFADLDAAPGSSLPVVPLLPIEPHTARTRINDGRIDRAGNFVFGTMNEDHDAPSGSFYQYSSRSGLRRLNVGGVVIPNSICFSVDGRTMYFCDSPTGVIRQCEYDADSAGVANVREFTRYAEGRGLPDGSIVDSEGCLWNAVWAAGVVRRFDPNGRLLLEIAVPSRNLTCAAFGGDSLDQLFVTSSRQEMSEQQLLAAPAAGGLFAVHPGVRGVSDTLFRD
ncbi:MAG TPA: SMP-30/gluconolactonase/LRE family protein [Vicinamibacterales bacterium]|nr:SMP-30/gluconolactonase/LRE family protein [Vicinamibacterales bacterium]